VALWARMPPGDFGAEYVTLVSTELLYRGGWEMNARLTTGDLEYHFGYWRGPGDLDYAHYECLFCVTTDRWVHIAAVLDHQAHTLSFYLDGAPRGAVAIDTLISPG